MGGRVHGTSIVGEGVQGAGVVGERVHGGVVGEGTQGVDVLGGSGRLFSSPLLAGVSDIEEEIFKFFSAE